MAADARRRGAYSQMARTASGVISFAGGMPDSTLFPTDAFRRVLNRVIREEGRELLQYYPSSGYPPLRQYLSGYLLRFGLEARPEDILIVNGTQQGFDLVARTLLDPGDFVAIEQPSYPRAMQVFRAFGAQLLPVPDVRWWPLRRSSRAAARAAGAQAALLPAQRAQSDGLHMPAAARRRLLDVAARHRLPIVEDGFDGTLFYGERPPVPLKAADASGQVIYLGTFSKILFPDCDWAGSSRSPELIERLEMAKQLADIHTSPLIQAAVYHFCRQRLLDRHQARALREYARRRNALLATLGRRMPEGVTWTETQGGFSLLLELPEGWTRPLSCRGPSSAGWPSPQARPSTARAEVSARCACPSPRCPSGRSRRACAASPTPSARPAAARTWASASAGRPCRWCRERSAHGLRDPGGPRRPRRRVGKPPADSAHLPDQCLRVRGHGYRRVGLGGKKPGFVYGRYGTANHTMLEDLVAALEGAEAAVACASGMGATTALLFGLFQSGDHLVAARDLYGSTAAFLSDEGRRLGIDTAFVDVTDTAAVLGAVRPNTRAVFVESLSNPLLRLADLDASLPSSPRAAST